MKKPDFTYIKNSRSKELAELILETTPNLPTNIVKSEVHTYKMGMSDAIEQFRVSEMMDALIEAYKLIPELGNKRDWENPEELLNKIEQVLIDTGCTHE